MSACVESAISGHSLATKLYQEPIMAQIVTVTDDDGDERFANLLDILQGVWEGYSERFDGETGAFIDHCRTEVHVGFRDDKFSRFALRRHLDGRVERSFHVGEVIVKDGRTYCMHESTSFTCSMSCQTNRLCTTEVTPKDPNKPLTAHSMTSSPESGIRYTTKQVIAGGKVTLEHVHERRISTVNVFYARDPEEMERELPSLEEMDGAQYEDRTESEEEEGSDYADDDEDMEQD